MRAGSDLYKRRSGLEYVKSEKKLFSYMLDKKFITKSEYTKAVVTRGVGALIPNGVRGFLYKRVLRG